MISAKIVADSVSMEMKRLTTFELEYPRYILAEVNTHTILSKNTASSRAIPVDRLIGLIEDNPVIPVKFGKNQSGMQAGEEIEDTEAAKEVWLEAAKSAIKYARKLSHKESLNVHKEVVNRLIEPFQYVRTVLSGTEWENMLFLRNHPDAQPEFQKLAEKIEEALHIHPAVLLVEGEWHVPYFEKGIWREGMGDLQDALDISVSCCAQVSYRRLDDSLEKARSIVSRLNLSGEGDDPAHASPSSHQGTPIDSDELDIVEFFKGRDYNGITHYHKDLGWMSGNFAGWKQYRQMIPNTTKW